MKSILFVFALVFMQINCNAKKEEATAVSFTFNTGDSETDFFIATHDSNVRNALRSDSVFRKWVNIYKTYLVSKPALEYFATYIIEHQVKIEKPMLPNYTIRVFDATGRIIIFGVEGRKRIDEYRSGLKRWMENSRLN